MQSSEDLGNTFTRAWDLLSTNWIIIVPAIIIAVIAGIIIALLGMFGMASAVGFGSLGMGGAGVGSLMLTGLIIGIVMLLASILTVAYTTGMADAAWRTGRVRWKTAPQRFGKTPDRYWRPLFCWSFSASLPLRCRYRRSVWRCWPTGYSSSTRLQASVVGKRSGTEALGESARITSKNFLMTLAIVVLLAIAFIIAAWVGNVLHHIPFLGAIVSYVINQVVAAFATLVIVGEYIKLRSGVVGVGTPPTATPPA